MEKYNEALETLSGALAIANAQVKHLQEENAQLKADRDRLLALVESQAKAVRGLATGKTDTGGVFLQPSHQPNAGRTTSHRAIVINLQG